ncbi:hypothetical protein DYB32_007766 [Aphanomyces invadans]|uniref:Mitochondrial pyruvate carrier n=1 Tax=Aphanomyces invadans TaxID=157072 RepID=A0A418AMS3_9STRA|nr:hypothetical protein DYB32_007766 [Aphanomyces invadans]
MKKSPELLSTNQQIAVALTGIIWSRYSLVVTPKNWNLFSVNVFMAGTGLTQLYRKFAYVHVLPSTTCAHAAVHFRWENGGREAAAKAAAEATA